MNWQESAFRFAETADDHDFREFMVRMLASRIGSIEDKGGAATVDGLDYLDHVAEISKQIKSFL